MNPQILLFRQKNKHVFIRITAYAGKYKATPYIAKDYKAYSISVKKHFYTDDLKEVINITINDIKNIKKLFQSNPEKLKALNWIEKQLYDSLQPKLF